MFYANCIHHEDNQKYVLIVATDSVGDTKGFKISQS